MNKLRIILVNLCRLALALTFLLSGYVKAIDPLGTLYKMQDYLGAVSLYGILPDWLMLMFAVGLSAMEFALGVMLLFAIRRRVVSRVMLVVMGIMTLITVWIFLDNPVKDCGCFGDAIVLTNAQTLAKNIVLLACAAVVSRWPLSMPRLISKTNQWIVANYTVVFILLTSLYSLYWLPPFDFRPYHIGANIKKGMEIPKGAEQPEFENTFVMRKNGQTREFTLDNYPDSTWEYVDTKTVQTKKGYEPPIHDFSITLRPSGEDITRQVLDRKGYTFLLVSPSLKVADDSNFGNIDQIYEYAEDYGVPFYCLTASTDSDVERWRDITGAEYPFCTTDETTLKTIIRSNPGLLLLKDGVIIGKWSHNQLPSTDELTAAPEKLPIGHLPDDSTTRRIAKVAAVFILPLLLLTMADRLWTWTKWIRKKRNLNILHQIFKTRRK